MSSKELLDLKEFFSKEFYDFKVEVVKDIAIVQQQNKEMIGHVKETNGRVKKNTADLNQMDEDIRELDGDINKRIERGFWRAVKVIGGVFLLGTFIWIKESRDFLMAIVMKVL